MKVNYKPLVREKIQEEIYKAKKEDREIESIELTDKEWISLLKELGIKRMMRGELTLMGVDIVKEAPDPFFKGYGNNLCKEVNLPSNRYHTRPGGLGVGSIKEDF